MSEEKANEFDWRSKADDIQSLPGYSFNKEAAWETIHARMQEKPRTKKLLWLWAAAACLLIAICSTWLFSVGKNKKVLVKAIANQKINSQLPQFTAPSKTQEVAGVSLVEFRKKHSFVFNKKNSKTNGVSNGNVYTKPSPGEKEIVQSPNTGNINKSLAPADTMSNVVIAPLVIRKLNVVHVNELGDQPEPSPVTAKYYQRRALQVKFINHELNKIPPSSGNTGFNLFKSRSPGSN